MAEEMTNGANHRRVINMTQYLRNQLEGSESLIQKAKGAYVAQS